MQVSLERDKYVLEIDGCLVGLGTMQLQIKYVFTREYARRHGFKVDFLYEEVGYPGQILYPDGRSLIGFSPNAGFPLFQMNETIRKQALDGDFLLDNVTSFFCVNGLVQDNDNVRVEKHNWREWLPDHFNNYMRERHGIL